MPRFSALARFVLGALLGGAVAGGALVGASMDPALAHASRSCLGPDYGAINDYQGDANPSTNRGTRSQMRVIVTSSVDCQHVGSIYAASTSSQAGVEYAYLIGYSNCAAGGTIYYATPTPFYWAYNASGGFIGCQLFGDTVSDGTDHEFRVSDVNDNGYWNVYFDGTSEGVSINDDFNNADNAISMERATSNDSGYEKWVDLEEYKTGVSSWSVWDTNHCGADTDPNYSCHVIDNEASTFSHD